MFPFDLYYYNSLADLADPVPSSQLIRVSANARLPKGGRRRITGMATTPHGDVLLSTKQGIMYRYLATKPWTPEDTSSWPIGFRRKVQTLLLCAAHKGEGSVLARLPTSVVFQIMHCLAGKRSDWLERLEEESEEEQPQQQAPAHVADAPPAP